MYRVALFDEYKAEMDSPSPLHGTNRHDIKVEGVVIAMATYWGKRYPLIYSKKDTVDIVRGLASFYRSTYCHTLHLSIGVDSTQDTFNWSRGQSRLYCLVVAVRQYHLIKTNFRQKQKEQFNHFNTIANKHLK